MGWVTTIFSIPRIFLLVVIAIAAVTILSISPRDAYATSYELEVDNSNGACNAISGSWNSWSNTCTLNTGLILNSGDSLQVDAGVTLEVASGYIDNGNILNSGGTIIKNFGTINSSGYINNYSGSTLDNSGTINNSWYIYNGGTINNSGTITNNSGGSITNNAGSTFTNSGRLNLNSGNTITFTGPSTYSGSFSDSGTLIMNSGSVIGVGSGTTLVISSGTTLVISSGTFSLQSGVTLYVGSSAILMVKSGTTLSNSGNIANYGGTIKNLGTINNNGTITNLCGRTINNSGMISGNLVVNGCHPTKTFVTPNPSFVRIGNMITVTGTIIDTSSLPTTPTGTISWRDGSAVGTFNNIIGLQINTCHPSFVSSNASACNITYKPTTTAL